MYRGWNGAGWAMAGHGFGFPWGGLIIGLLFFALATVLVIAIVRMGKAGRLGYDSAKTKGIDILVERFARGEIDAETFRAMKAELETKK
jgi:putative membrane protein